MLFILPFEYPRILQLPLHARQVAVHEVRAGDGARDRRLARARIVLQQDVPAAGEGGRSLATVVAVDSANAVLMRGDASTLAKMAAMGEVPRVVVPKRIGVRI